MSVGPTDTVLVADAPAPDLEPEGEAAKKIEGRSPWRLAYERLRSDRATVISFTVIVLLIILAFAAPLIASLTGHGVNQQFRTTGLSPEGLPTGPGSKFLLGTDDQGRDVLVRIAYGTRISLIVGLLGTVISVAIGAVLGLCAGFFGGLIDTVISRIIDIILSLPYLLFAIALVSIHGPSFSIVIIVISLFSWSSVARIVRGQVLSIREREYVEASRSLGAPAWRIMFVDILPNVIAQLTVLTTLLIPATILFEAALSFLGVGPVDPTPAWGLMVSDGKSLLATAPHLLFFPGAAIFLTVLAFVFVGDGLRDALDPKLK